MAVRTYSGRIAQAIAFSKLDVFIAWGTGEPTWFEEFTETHQFDENDTLTLTNTPVAKIKSLKGQDGRLYNPDVDYAAIAANGTIIRTLSGMIPQGAPVTIEYETEGGEITSFETSLVNEVGRRRAKSIQFIEPDENGAFEDYNRQRWSISKEPTNVLLVSAQFGYDENPDEIIREAAIFVGTVVKDGVPVGQDYLTPDQIEDPGYLHDIEHVGKIIRSSIKRAGIDAVVTF